ncbi:MAG: hypothetical protein ACYDC6_07705 [Acidobacteriaceae bacterium]
MQAAHAIQNQPIIDTILHGDCVTAMHSLPANSIDFILTDPPYLVNYRDRNGRKLQNDCDGNWLKPAMAAAFRVLKQNRLMVCFTAGRGPTISLMHGVARVSVRWGISYFASPTHRA